MKVQQAVARLGQVLPIKRILDQLDPVSAEVYLAVVNAFYSKGRAPTLDELGSISHEASQIVKHLSEQDMLTLDESGGIKGCYPFTMEPRVHRIRINGHQVHAMCALDALAPSAMFSCSSKVDSECAVSGASIHIELDDQAIVNQSVSGDVHFGINWMAASSCCSCSDSLCTEMIFLKDAETASQWQQQDAENRETFTLPEAIAFSAGFFKPMMQQG